MRAKKWTVCPNCGRDIKEGQEIVRDSPRQVVGP
jgi:hypothetical protein